MAQNWHNEYADRKNGRKPVVYEPPRSRRDLGSDIRPDDLPRTADASVAAAGGLHPRRGRQPPQGHRQGRSAKLICLARRHSRRAPSVRSTESALSDAGVRGLKQATLCRAASTSTTSAARVRRTTRPQAHGGYVVYRTLRQTRTQGRRGSRRLVNEYPAERAPMVSTVTRLRVVLC